MKSILDESKFWFLDQLNYTSAQLLIEVTEGIVSSSPQDVQRSDMEADPRWILSCQASTTGALFDTHVFYIPTIDSSTTVNLDT